MDPKQLLSTSLCCVVFTWFLAGCQTTTQDASSSLGPAASIAGAPKVLHFDQPRITKATFASIDRENSRFLKTVIVDYPIIVGTYSGPFTHVPSRDNKKVHVYEGPIKVTMETDLGIVEQATVTGSAFLQRADLAKGAVNSESLSYRFTIPDSMKEPVQAAKDRIKPQSNSNATGSGSIAAIAAAAVVNATVSAGEQMAAAPVLTFRGNNNQDYRKNYYGKNFAATEQVKVSFPTTAATE